MNSTTIKNELLIIISLLNEHYNSYKIHDLCLQWQNEFIFYLPINRRNSTCVPVVSGSKCVSNLWNVS